MILLKTKKKKEMPSINTTALPDIIFMLLFFFMVTTVMRQPDSTEQLVLPITITSESTERSDTKELVVSLYKNSDQQDVVQIQNKITSVDQVQNSLNLAITKMKQNQIFPKKAILKIDQHIKMSTVNKLKTALQKAEILKVEYVHHAGNKTVD